MSLSHKKERMTKKRVLWGFFLWTCCDCVLNVMCVCLEYGIQFIRLCVCVCNECVWKKMRHTKTWMKTRLSHWIHEHPTKGKKWCACVCLRYKWINNFFFFVWKIIEIFFLYSMEKFWRRINEHSVNLYAEFVESVEKKCREMSLLMNNMFLWMNIRDSLIFPSNYSSGNLLFKMAKVRKKNKRPTSISWWEWENGLAKNKKKLLKIKIHTYIHYI